MSWKFVKLLFFNLGLKLLFHLSCAKVVDKDLQDQNEKYRLCTEYCNEKSKCGIANVQANCNCDDLCRIFNDCCSNVDDKKSGKEIKTKTGIYKFKYYKREQFSCERFSAQEGRTSALMVSKCPTSWVDKKTSQLCEDRNMTDTINTLLTVPVSSPDSSVIFRNMYCAFCNNIFDFQYWTFEIVPINNSNVTRIQFHYEPNITYSTVRNCGYKSVHFISKCFKNKNVTARQSRSYDLCRSKPVLVVYDEKGKAYKNEFCALCNGILERNLLCDFEKYTSMVSRVSNRVYSYRFMVDFNLRHVKTFDNIKYKESSFKICERVHDEIYDPLSMTCRKLYCPPMLIAENGKCISKKGLVSSYEQTNEDCAFLELKEHEYEILNGTSIYLISLNRTVDSSKLFVNNTSVYICNLLLQNVTTYYQFSTLDIVEYYLTLFGLIFSIIALVITMLVYIMIPDLRNLPGKNLMSLMTALLLAQFLFLFSSHAVNDRMACTIIAICVHYFFLSSFSWMNVIAYDLFITFSQSQSRVYSQNSRLFYRYSVYAWLFPSLIVVPAIIIEFSSSNDSKFKPRYGEPICLISSKYALILFFLGPLAIFKLFDIAAFVCTSCHISMSRRQSSVARRYTFCSFLLYIKLSFIMGLTWLFAFVALLSNNKIIWYLFIIFNTMQGVFIGLSFLLTKRTITLLKTKMRMQRNRQSTSRILTTTQSTSC